MKKIILLSLIAISAIALNSCSSGTARETTSKENISFYDVPLVCPAATQIGCGSRAKPVLLEMEKNSAIKEAWLNRAGTVYAIVWSSADETKKIAKPIFEKYNIDYSELKGDDAEKNLATFRKENFWYRGAEVDKLSIEEAGVIANDAVTFALNEKLVSETEVALLRTGIENYLKTELVKVRTVDELYGDASQAKFKNELSVIAAKTIGQERADKIIELYMQKKSFEKNKDACCKKKSVDACCKRK